MEDAGRKEEAGLFDGHLTVDDPELQFASPVKTMELAQGWWAQQCSAVCLVGVCVIWGLRAVQDAACRHCRTLDTLKKHTQKEEISYNH